MEKVGSHPLQPHTRSWLGSALPSKTISQGLQGVNDPTNYREGQKRDFALTSEHIFFIFFFSLWTYEMAKVFQVCSAAWQESLPVLGHPSPPGYLGRRGPVQGDVSRSGISWIPLH